MVSVLREFIGHCFMIGNMAETSEEYLQARILECTLILDAPASPDDNIESHTKVTTYLGTLGI